MNYEVGSVIIFTQPCWNNQGLLARTGDLGLVVNEGLVDEEHHIHWVCWVYVNGHPDVGVDDGMVRIATPEESERFWKQQSDVYRADRSVTDAVIENLKITQYQLDQALKMFKDCQDRAEYRDRLISVVLKKGD